MPWGRVLCAGLGPWGKFWNGHLKNWKLNLKSKNFKLFKFEKKIGNLKRVEDLKKLKIWKKGENFKFEKKNNFKKSNMKKI